jgi:hypothetical protein
LAGDERRAFILPLLTNGKMTMKKGTPKIRFIKLGHSMRLLARVLAREGSSMRPFQVVCSVPAALA